MFHLVETGVVISVLLVILKRNKTQKKSIVITRPPLFVYIADEFIIIRGIPIFVAFVDSIKH